MARGGVSFSVALAVGSAFAIGAALAVGAAIAIRVAFDAGVALSAGVGLGVSIAVRFAATFEAGLGVCVILDDDVAGRDAGSAEAVVLGGGTGAPAGTGAGLGTSAGQRPCWAVAISRGLLPPLP